MALVLADRVRDTTTTTGTGTVTLSGTAPTGYQNFSVIGNSNTTYYTINAGSQWEVGIGTYSSTGPTLARTTVLASSNSGSLVDFSTGTKDVFVTYPAEKSVNYDASDNVGIGTTSPGVLLDVFSTAGPIIKNRSSTVNTTLRGFEIQTVNDIHASFKAEPSSGELRIASGFSTWGGYQTFYTNGSERMRITSAGDVGIGTTSPNSAGVNRAITVNGTSNSIVEVNYGGTRGAYLFSNASGTVLSSVQNLRLQLNTNDTPRVTIDNSGNVGVGTDTPTDLLTVSNGSIASTIAGSGAGLQMGRIAMYSSALGAAYTNYGGEIRSYSGAGIDVSDLRFYTANGAATTERMRITSAGNVGIGTTAPQNYTNLRSVGISGSQGAVLDFSASAVGVGTNRVAQLYGGNGGFLVFSTGASDSISEAMRIDASRNVGIGTTSPTSRLTISSGQFTSPALNIIGGGPNQGWLRLGNNADIKGGDDLLGMTFTVGASERMKIDTVGNVGIGTSSPAARLTVSLAAGSVAGGQLIVKDPNYSGVALVQGGSGEGYLWNTSNNFLSIATNNTERMRIDSSGNLLVGTTTANAKTTIQQTGNAEGLRVSNSTASMSAVHQYSVLFGSGNKNTTAVHFGAFTQDANVFFVFGNGNVQNTNNSYGAISDIKFKENVVDATPKLDALMQVRVVNYNLKSQPDEKHIGVIAQELEEIFPGLVEEAPERDSSGELTSETSKSVKYSVFVPMLIKALQEANGKIDALTARVAELEGK